MSSQFFEYYLPFYGFPVLGFAMGWRIGGRRFPRSQIYVLLVYFIIFHAIALSMDDLESRAFKLAGGLTMGVFFCWFMAFAELLRKYRSGRSNPSDCKKDEPS